MFERLSLFVALAVAWAPNAIADAGEALHEEHCTRCHGSEVYTREDRNVHSLAGLEAQVRRCDQNLGLTWFDDEVSQVTGYLNDHYYKFEP